MQLWRHSPNRIVSAVVVPLDINPQAKKFIKSAKGKEAILKAKHITPDMAAAIFMCDCHSVSNDYRYNDCVGPGPVTVQSRCQ